MINLNDSVDTVFKDELLSIYGNEQAIPSFGVEENLRKSLAFYHLFDHKLLMVALIEKGISIELFQAIVKESPYSLAQWSEFTGIPYRTIQRYNKEDKYLKPVHAEKVLEISEVLKKGLDVFGDGKKLLKWLGSEKYIFGNKKPIDLLSNSVGKDLVMQELHRIEHGLFA